MNKNSKRRMLARRKARDYGYVKPAPGHLASVARHPVLDKTMPHWTMMAMNKFVNARTRAEALEIIKSVQP